MLFLIVSNNILDLVRKNKIKDLILFKMIHYYEKLFLLLIYRETLSNATHDYLQYFLNPFTVKLKYFEEFFYCTFANLSAITNKNVCYTYRIYLQSKSI